MTFSFTNRVRAGSLYCRKSVLLLANALFLSFPVGFWIKLFFQFELIWFEYLQELVKKHSASKLVLTFQFWINSCSYIKNLEITRIIFLAVGQNNCGNKIPVFKLSAQIYVYLASYVNCKDTLAWSTSKDVIEKWKSSLYVDVRLGNFFKT